MGRRKKWSSRHGYGKSNLLNTLWLIFIGLALVGCSGTLGSLRDSSVDMQPAVKGKEEQKKEIVQQVYKLQMPFIANEGQIQNERVLFYAKTFGVTAYVTKTGEIVYSLSHSLNPKSDIPNQKSKIQNFMAGSSRRHSSEHCLRAKDLIVHRQG